MSYKEWAPPEDLKGIVKCFWHMEKTYAENPDPGETVWPDGRVEILFTFGARYKVDADGNRELPGSFVIGPLTMPVELHAQGWLKLFGIRLQAWGFTRLFPERMHRLKDKLLPLETFVRNQWDMPEMEALQDLPPEEAVEKLTAWVRELSRKNHLSHDPVLPALALHLEKPSGGLTIQEWAESSGWSARQLERKFKDEIGVSPKQLWQIYRFNEARQTLLFSPDTDLMEVAYRCGYYDYSHFSKAFVRYFRMTPKAFQRWVRSGRDNRLADPEDVVFIQDFEPSDRT